MNTCADFDLTDLIPPMSKTFDAIDVRDPTLLCFFKYLDCSASTGSLLQHLLNAQLLKLVAAHTLKNLILVHGHGQLRHQTE